MLNSMRLFWKVTLVVLSSIILVVIWTILFLPPFLETVYAWVPQRDGVYIFSKDGVRIFATVFILGIPLTVAIMYAINLIVIEPLLSINEVTKIIATGNLGKKAAITSNDEFGELSNNLNIMIKNLATAFQSMSNSLRETREKSVVLAKNVTELEEARRVALQTLDDLNVEKTKLEEANAKDVALLESIGDSVVATNSSEEIIFANKEALQTTLWRIEDLRGKLYSNMLPSLDEHGIALPEVEQPVRRALVTSQKIPQVCHYRRRDQTLFVVSVVATPVAIGGNIIGSIVVFRDVTKEKEVDRMKTEFISLASHQLRTPLSAIRWFTELLLDESSGKLTDEQKELAKNVSDSADRMVALVNSLLNISRIESGRIIIDPQPTDLVTLVKEVISDLQAKIAEKKQNLAVSAHESLPKINIDPKLIRQVYMNLLTNAIKYSPEGGQIVVFISRKGTEVISQISDNGYGIPKHEQRKMFQKFFRAENIVKVETDGNGLGLYLVKAIIESSKGRIWFQSEEGKGTTFWFSLPIAGTPAKHGEVSLDPS